jgi:hypothetical protein
VPAFWLQASLPKKATYVLLPFALLATLYVLLADDDAAPTRTTSPRAGASVEASAAPPPAATTADTTAVVPVPRPVPTDRAPRPAPGKRTPDREVVDLIAAGSYADAARRLDDLAAAQPDHPEYREAARILRAKAGQEGRPP